MITQKINDASSATQKRIELHVYILPPNFWIKDKNLAYNETIKESISLGFIRTSQDLHLIDLRKEILTQCNKNEIPKSYVFLKSVGRAFAKVKPLQEQELKVKHFLPFQEIFILETNNNKENLKPDQFHDLPQSRMFNNSTMQKNSPNQFTKSWESFEKNPSNSNTDKANEFDRLMKEQERLRNRQIELENLRNKHSKSQFDQRLPVSRTMKKNEQDDLNDNDENETNDSNEPSEDYYYQTPYQNNGSIQPNNDHHGVNSRINNNNVNNNNKSSTNNRGTNRFFNDKTQIKIVDDYDNGSEYVEATETQNKSRNNGTYLKHSNNIDSTNGHLTNRNGNSTLKNVDDSKHYSVTDLKEKLKSTKKSRIEFEFLRDELIKHLKQIHNRITIRRKDARDIWKKKYFTEKKKTPLLEENVNALLNEIQTYQNKIIHALDSDVKNAVNDDQKKETDLKSNELISYKLQEENYLLKRQVDQFKLKLTTDIKLRNQAETEIKALKTELFQTKLNINQLKNSF